MLVEPGDRLVRDDVAGHVRWRAAPADLRGIAIAVSLKALGQAEAPIERKGRDECRCRKPRLTQRVCDRRNGGIEPHAVVARSVPGRVPPRHDRGVRSQRDGRGAESGVEACAARRERIDGWRPGRSIAVRTDAIGAQRVDRDEKEVSSGRSRGCLLRRSFGAGGAEGDEKSRAGSEAHQDEYRVGIRTVNGERRTPNAERRTPNAERRKFPPLFLS